MPAVVLLQLGDELPDDVHIADVAESVDDGERVHVGLLDQVFQLMRLIVGVDGHEDGADLGRGEHQSQPFGDVARPDADVRALGDADGQQALRHVGGALVKVLVAPDEAAVGIHDEGMVWLGMDQIVEEVGDGLFGEKFFAHGR